MIAARDALTTQATEADELERIVRRVVAEVVPAIVRELANATAATPAAAEPSPLLDRKALAARLGCSMRTLDQRVAAGQLPKSLKVGRHVRWPLRTIEAWESAGMPNRRRWESMQRNDSGRSEPDRPPRPRIAS